MFTPKDEPDILGLGEFPARFAFDSFEVVLRRPIPRLMRPGLGIPIEWDLPADLE